MRVSQIWKGYLSIYRGSDDGQGRRPLNEHSPYASNVCTASSVRINNPVSPEMAMVAPTLHGASMRAAAVATMDLPHFRTASASAASTSFGREVILHI